MGNNLATAADRVVDALYERDLEGARARFGEVVKGASKATVDEFLKVLAATVELPEGAVVWGFGIDIWSNPHRHDFAWRCGGCRWTGSNYRTGRAARDAATEHAGEHSPALKVEAFGDEEYAAAALRVAS